MTRKVLDICRLSDRPNTPARALENCNNAHARHGRKRQPDLDVKKIARGNHIGTDLGSDTAESDEGRVCIASMLTFFSACSTFSSTPFSSKSTRDELMTSLMMWSKTLPTAVFDMTTIGGRSGAAAVAAVVVGDGFTETPALSTQPRPRHRASGGRPSCNDFPTVRDADLRGVQERPRLISGDGGLVGWLPKARRQGSSGLEKGSVDGSATRIACARSNSSL